MGEEMVETDHDKVKRRKRILRKEREDRDGESREEMVETDHDEAGHK